jgi:hypothetical protein
MTKYVYKGPVVIFGKLVSNNWSGETVAPSRKKALNNLAFRFKETNNLIVNHARVSLMDKYLYEVDE